MLYSVWSERELYFPLDVRSQLEFDPRREGALHDHDDGHEDDLRGDLCYGHDDDLCHGQEDELARKILWALLHVDQALDVAFNLVKIEALK